MQKLCLIKNYDKTFDGIKFTKERIFKIKRLFSEEDSEGVFRPKSVITQFQYRSKNGWKTHFGL